MISRSNYLIDEAGRLIPKTPIRLEMALPGLKLMSVSGNVQPRSAALGDRDA